MSQKKKKKNNTRIPHPVKKNQNHEVGGTICHILSVSFLAEKLQGHFPGHPNPIFSTIFNFKVMPKNHCPEKGMRTLRLYYYHYYCYCFHVTVGLGKTGGRNLKNSLHEAGADGACCFLGSGGSFCVVVEAALCSLEKRWLDHSSTSELLAELRGDSCHFILRT